MKIQVLGTGCKKCDQLYLEAEKAIQESSLNIELLKVDKLDEIMKFGVLFTPALAIDGEVKSAGKVCKSKEISLWIQKASQTND